ncbi:MAG: acyl carrier protein [Phycisphaerae bacterium SM23_30]|nr:MAG: acyl carrier protein [Phycisphaerae bacterium SM23_30]
MTISQEEICTKVRETLVDALGVDDDEITDDATLMGDLGAESIDFLDIVFRLEKAFGIKIPREELFPPENLLNDPQYVTNGRLNESGLEKLKEQMPHVDFTEFAKDPDLNKMPDLFRVKSICDYVGNKVNAG